MNAITPAASTRSTALTTGNRPQAIVPTDMEGAWRIAVAIDKARMAPPGLETPEKCLIAIMHGLEIGLTPMAALQRIAIVNNRPTIWGDAAIGLVRGSGLCEWIKETITGEGDKRIAVCEAKRRGEPDPVVRRFSVDDAKAAGLWSKSGPWKQYPERMLQMRARAFALRDGFADVLGGLYLREEIEEPNGGARHERQSSTRLEPPAPPPEIAPENDVIDTTYTEHAPPEPPAEAAHQAGDNAPSNLSPAATNPEDFDSEKIVSDFEAAVTGASESLLDDLRDDVFAKIEGMDMPRAFRTRIQNAYENALQKLQPPEPPANEQPEPPAPAPEPEPARQEVGDDGFPDTTPQESEDVQLAAVQKDHAAMVRQLARQKARKGISFWKRWKGGLKPDELEIVEAMVEYSDGTLQAWAKRADAARPKDDF